MSSEYEAYLRGLCAAAHRLAASRMTSIVNGAFHVAHFTEAMQDDLQTRRRPAEGACRELLLSLPFMVSLGFGWFTPKWRNV